MGENNTKGKEMNNNDPFVVISQDGGVSKDRFETEYLAQLSVPFKDRHTITVKRVSELPKG